MAFALWRRHLVQVSAFVVLVLFVVAYWNHESLKLRLSSFPSSKGPDSPNQPHGVNPHQTSHQTLTSQSSTPEATPQTGAVVVAAHSTTDLEWQKNINTRYNYDDVNPPANRRIPANKGHEAMTYLTFIITNYDALPNYSIFVHGHRHSWHQEGDIAELINNLRLQMLDRDGYVPLRCDWYPSCPAEIRPIDHDAVVWGPGVHRSDAETEIAKAWQDLFGSTPLPSTIASQCCAQFAVTRKAIRRHAKSDYERMRDWLLQTDLIDDISGRVFEKLWAYIMTGETVRCPPPQQCACDYFGQCTAKTWPIPPAGLKGWE
ncbi:hypothetical protein OPT61_g3833 [Boeremia exigua]|uniref:Uncharacterized protein n=1 Tax=Boeremia exigua TaxID=749465 RepID=A0ACC2IGI3_9PLEO|nr:hypothetical protein OPT61_g3833 [Boeremia exigua]